MSKIALKITKISGGAQDLATFNPGEWTRKVSDIRSEMKLLSGNSLIAGEPVILLSYTEKGILLTLCHYIPGRSGDLVSAWVFFPAEIDISAAEQLRIINCVKAEITKSEVENWDSLGLLCQQEYPNKRLPFSFGDSPATAPCAVRYYGSGTDFELRELLGKHLYQSYYTDHHYVFFIDKSTDIVADDRLVNYTGDPLREYIVIPPAQLPSDITAWINGIEFSKPMLFVSGEKLTVTYKRQGFNDISVPYLSGEPLPDPTQLPWQRHFTPNIFQITDNEGNNVGSSCLIQFNGQRLTPNGIDLSEEKCKAVKIAVDAPDCEPYSNTFNLLTTPPFHIVLQRKKIDIIYRINGIEHPSLTECPEGYTCKEYRKGNKIYRDCIYEQPATTVNWKMIALIGTIAAFLIGLGLGILTHTVISNRKQDSKVTEGQEQPEGKGADNSSQKSTVDTTLDSKVYNCLSSNIWEKEKIEAEPELRGFFKDVLKCNYSELTGHWATAIDTSANPKWRNLLDAIKKKGKSNLQDFRWDLNATQIDIRYYIRSIDTYNRNNNTTSSTSRTGNTTSRKNNNNNTGRQDDL